jgi:hypothetical protein
MIKAELKITLLLLMANGSAKATANSDRLCSIGLEWFTSKGKTIKRNRREEARIAVLTNKLVVRE